MQEAWTRTEGQERRRPTFAYFVGGLGTGRRGKPHKKSYVSGFFHLMKERLTKERAYRREHRHFIEPPPPVEPVALLPEPEPWVPPPPNPLALMIVPKLERCCPDGIPGLRCPACIEFDKYARRKLAKVARALAKQVPEPPPEEDAGPSDDPEYESQHDDDLEPQSYMAGQSAARSLDLNELKL
jgi:hypothetical protein